MTPDQLSPLSLAALGIFGEGPTHPYEVYRLMLSRREDRVVKLRPGTLYHAIAKLEQAGQVDVVGTDRDGNRPERTTYKITAKGRATLTGTVRQMLERPIYEFPQFPVALGEAHALPVEVARQAVVDRRSLLATELAAQDTGVQTIQAKQLPRIYWLDVSYQRAMVVAELAWLDQLLSDLDTKVVDWTDRTVDHHSVDVDSFHVPTPLHPELPPRKA